MRVEIITSVSFEFTPHQKCTYWFSWDTCLCVHFSFPRSHSAYVSRCELEALLAEETSQPAHPLTQVVFSWQWRTRNPHRRPLRRSNSLKAPRRLCGDHSGCLSSSARWMASILIGWVTCRVLSDGTLFTQGLFHWPWQWWWLSELLFHKAKLFLYFSYVTKTFWFLCPSYREL